MIWCIKTYIIAYAKIQKNEDILSSILNLQPNWCLKIDFQTVDQHGDEISRPSYLHSGITFTRRKGRCWILPYFPGTGV